MMVNPLLFRWFANFTLHTPDGFGSSAQ